MKRHIKAFVLLLSIVIIACMFSVSVSANSALMPGFEVALHNPTNTECCVTLLTNISDYKKFAIHSDGDQLPHNLVGYEEIMEKLSEYASNNNDEVYFNDWYCSVGAISAKNLEMFTSFGRFQVLVYFPSTDKYIVSEIIKPYAVESKYSIEITENEIVITSNFDSAWNIVALAVRIIVTISLELIIALLFGFKGKKKIIPIVIVNLITQAGLNIGMNVFHVFVNNEISLIIYYFLLEIAVFIVEAVIYNVIFRKNDKTISTAKINIYAFVSNFVSFVASPLIARMMKGIF